jgi:hypothetical protein
MNRNVSKNNSKAPAASLQVGLSTAVAVQPPTEAYHRSSPDAMGKPLDPQSRAISKKRKTTRGAQTCLSVNTLQCGKPKPNARTQTNKRGNTGKGERYQQKIRKTQEKPTRKTTEKAKTDKRKTKRNQRARGEAQGNIHFQATTLGK